MEDNTPLLNAVSVSLRRIKRKRQAMKEAKRLIGEDEEQDILFRQLTDQPTVALGCDTAVFYYPDVSMGVPVAGPSSPKAMCKTFFRDKLPAVFPDAKEATDQLNVSDMTDMAISRGMVVLFGVDGVMTQVMAEKPYDLARRLKGIGILKEVFDDFANELVWLDSYNSVSDERIPFDKVIGSGHVAWRDA